MKDHATSTPHQSQEADLAEIQRAFRLLKLPGEVTELRGLGVPERSKGGFRRTCFGYFDDVELMAKYASEISNRGADGVYVTLNPVKPDLKARVCNKLKFAEKGELTSDTHIVCLRWLLVDADPLRVSGVSSTQAEHEAALEKVRSIRRLLGEQFGFPSPLMADSGNGGHLLYRLSDLPAEECRLTARCIEALDYLLSDVRVTVDKTVFNPARISKVYGSWARKGDDIPERPHRISRILDAPETLEPVPRDTLEKLAAAFPQEPEQHSSKIRGGGNRSNGFDLEEWLGTHRVPAEGPREWNGRLGRARLWTFPVCPFSPDHHGTARVLQFDSGGVSFGCFHTSCHGKGWRDLRSVYEPEPRSVGPPPVEVKGEEERAAGETPDETANEDLWPQAIPREAYHGLAGEFVEATAPHSEADPVALLTTFLICLGNLIGDRPHFVAEEDKHPARLFKIDIGESSKGRKGVSRGRVLRLLEDADPQWRKNIKSGLVSGEGLIYHVRDPIEEDRPVKEKGRVVRTEKVVVDSGIKDKRLLVLEDEFSSALKVMKREGNTLSPVLRSAWDRGDLTTLAKNAPIHATGAHVSIIGHITRVELVRHLDETECANGFGNRFLWVCVRRSQVLPFGGRLDPEALRRLQEKVRTVVLFASRCGEVQMDPQAAEYWREVYPQLSEGRPDLVGSLTARGEAQVVRLALLYAVLDASPEIRRHHLEAALAVWVYSFNSVRHVFGEKTGDPVADKVLKELQKFPGGLNLTQLHRAFKNHLRGERLREALLLLERSSLCRQHIVNMEEQGSELRWFAKI